MTFLRTAPALTLAAALCGALAGCSTRATPDEGAKATVKEPVATGVLSTMDKGVDPCQDFYHYACGGWIKNTPLPSDQASWGRGFNEIFERNRDVIREILEKEAPTSSDPNLLRIGNFYASCMDEAAVEAAGLTPLKPWMDKIDQVSDNRSLMVLLAQLHMLEWGPLFAFGVAPDYANPNMVIAHVFQGGIGLPERDFYLRDDEGSKGLRAAYQDHVGKMLALMGTPAEKATSDAAAILAFETELARASMPVQEIRDPNKRYHKIDLAGLQALTPNLPWDAYLGALGISASFKDINVGTPDFFKALDPLLAKTDSALLKTYLRWHLIDGVAPLLSQAIVAQNFEFNGKLLSGQQEISARWKRCSNATGSALPDIVSRAFVDRRFAGDSKEISREMIHDIEESFKAGLPQLAWMDDATRAAALEKIAAINNKIGYPDKWRDYSSVNIEKSGYFGNMMAAREFESRRQLAKLGGPVDKAEWMMPAYMVNAYYSPTNNEIVFPAGILQAPFFSAEWPMAMNFGAIGMVMGHELTHGFDDQGRKFDKDGMLRPWWAEDVSKRFEERAACVEKQYSSYEVVPGTFLNGKLTLGENIADMGGIKSAWGAWKAWEATNKPAAAVDGLSNDQLFFVAFAQSWCNVSTPEAEKLQAQTDPHSIERYRVNGPLQNFPTFAQTFQCKEGTPMAPAQRCEVW